MENSAAVHNIYEYFWGGAGTTTVSTEGWLNPENLGTNGADSLTAHIRSLVARDAAIGHILKDDFALLQNYKMAAYATQLDQAMKDSNADLIARLSCEAIADICNQDTEFYHRFDNLVTIGTTQNLAVLPVLAEKAFMAEVWRGYEEGIYLYDSESDGDFLDWLTNIRRFTEDASPGEMSDYSFLFQTLFPFLKNKGIPVSQIINNPSKARSAVPALRILYNEVLKGDKPIEDILNSLSGVVQDIGNAQVSVAKFNTNLKDKGLKASRYDPYDIKDHMHGDGGTLMLAYPSEAAKTRILNRLGDMVNRDNIGFFTEDLSATTHYAVWAGRAVDLLEKAKTPGINVNPEWDGKTVGFICIADTPEAAKIATQKLYAAGFSAERPDNGNYVVLVWGKETVIDPFEGSEEGMIF